jgi:hypothetical protein
LPPIQPAEVRIGSKAALTASKCDFSSSPNNGRDRQNGHFRKVPTADIANLFPCGLDRNMLPRDGSGRCVEGSSLLVPEDHPDARSRMMLT